MTSNQSLKFELSTFVDFVERNVIDEVFIERVRTLFELNRSCFYTKFSHKFGVDAYLITYYCIVLLFRRATVNELVDFVYLNPLLWLFEDPFYKRMLSSLPAEKCSHAESLKIQIFRLAFHSKPYSPTFHRHTLVKENVSLEPRSDCKVFSVVLLCPNPYSLYSLITLDLLKNQGIEIKGVFVKNIYSFKRFKSEFRRDGKRLLKKVWRKLILRKSESNCSGENIQDLFSELSIRKQSINSWCRSNAVPLLTVDDFCSPKILNTINDMNVDLTVFTGGGIISKELLASSRLGVINCHMGILPGYRGMDVVQWPLLENNFDYVGLCTHLMEQKIDAGPIVDVLHVNPNDYKSLYSLRNAIEKKMPLFMVKSILLLRDLKPLVMQVKLTRTYFRMHPILEARILNYNDL